MLGCTAVKILSCKRFSMLQALKTFALLGGEWVLYILIALSLWGLAEILDRFFLFRVRAKDAERLGEKAPELLARGDFAQVRKLVQNVSSPEGAVLKSGLEKISMKT